MPKLGKMLAAFTASSSDCTRPARGPRAGFIPNVVVRTHMNQRAWFYDDLIWQKTVLIHCMSLSDTESCANVRNLAQLQPLIAGHLGRSVFIYSITTDPQHDSPAALRDFAQESGVRDGWLFLTGDGGALRLIRERLFSHGAGQDCSMHLLRYGNEALGLWGGTLARSEPHMIAQRLSWIMPSEAHAGPPRRGGPPVLSQQEQDFWKTASEE